MLKEIDECAIDMQRLLHCIVVKIILNVSFGRSHCWDPIKNVHLNSNTQRSLSCVFLALSVFVFIVSFRCVSYVVDVSSCRVCQSRHDKNWSKPIHIHSRTQWTLSEVRLYICYLMVFHCNMMVCVAMHMRSNRLYKLQTFYCWNRRILLKMK